MLGGCFVAVGTAAKTRSAQSNLFRVLYMGKCPFVEQSLNFPYFIYLFMVVKTRKEEKAKKNTTSISI